MFSMTVNKLEISYLTFKWYTELKELEFKWETISFKLNKFNLLGLEEDSTGNVIFNALVLRMKLLSKTGPDFLSKRLSSILSHEVYHTHVFKYYL